MKQTRLSITLWSTLITMACTSLVWAAPPTKEETPPNWGQVDAPALWECPTANGPESFAPLPASVAITTTGRPVVMSVSMDLNGWGSQYRAILDLTVDGVPLGAAVDFLSFYSGTHTLTRIVALPTGAHSFGVILSCMTGGSTPLMVRRGWVSVFELK